VLSSLLGQNRVLEGVRCALFGDSWGNNAAGGSDDIVTAFPYRVAARNRTQAIIDKSVTGTRSDQILAAVQANWTVPGRGLVILADVVLNDVLKGSDTNTCRESFRSILTYLTALYVAPYSGSTMQFGPGWTAGVSDGTAGRYVDVAFNGDAVSILWGGVTGSGGTFTVTDTTGTVKATKSTGGFSQPFTGSTKVAGFGSGDHTVRVAATTGAVTVVGSASPLANPPVILWNQPGNLPAQGTTANTQIAAFITDCATVLTDFPTVIQVPVDSGWDPTTMVYSDGLHLNSKGNAYTADRCQQALAASTYLQGLNSLSTAQSYTPPTPTYTRPGATAPAAPTGVAATTGNQAGVTWTRGSDGGATITSQAIRASSDGGSTWVTVLSYALPLTPASVAATVVSGLTSGTSYVFQVGATNSVGTTWSASSAAVTVGAALTIYMSDPLTGSGALGTMAGGGQTIVTPYGTWQRTGAGVEVVVSVTNQNIWIANDSQNTGVWVDQFNGTAIGGSAIGMLFCCTDTTGDNGYLFWDNGGVYTLSKRTTKNQTTIGSVSTVVTPASGDVVAITKTGTSITVKVNGTTTHTATDATYSGTCHGGYAYSGSKTLTHSNYQHHN
jgi:hypothetical protein